MVKVFINQDGKILLADGKLMVASSPQVRVVPGGSASGVSLSKYPAQQEDSYKQELVDSGEFTAEEMSEVTLLNITGTSAGTVRLDVSELGNVGDDIKIMHKKSTGWESLYDDKIPSDYIVEVNLTEFSPIVGSKYTPKAMPKYVTFTAQEPKSSVKIEIQGNLSPITLYYSTDNTTWLSYEIGTVITLTNAGDYVSFYGKGNQRANYSLEDYLHFVMTGKIAGSGNCNALLDSDADYTTANCFFSLFNWCSSLTQAPELPATILASDCYHSMFNGCKSLTKAPELPATTLVESCYYSMFQGCTSLTQAPKLPATTLANHCYTGMFQGCTSLTQAPKLPATELANYCYTSMFQGCTSLTEAPELPATTLATYCYQYMFYGCTSLTQSPELPAATLVANCYQQMFQGCTKLASVYTAVIDWNTSYASNWLKSVASSGTVHCPEDSDIPSSNSSGKPSGWSRVDWTPSN